MPDPVHIISLGAGVQSSTMALMAAAGEITPMPIAAIFADTQAEPASVYRWLDWLEKQLPFPVHRVTAGNLADRELMVFRSKKSGKLYRKSMIPAFTASQFDAGMLRRKCTTEYKVQPITNKLRELVGAEGKACQWIGISLDEAHRMKDPRLPWIEHRWPLVDMRMNRNDCLRWMEARYWERPPRSACVFCPFHSDAEWRRLKTTAPDDFEAAVQFEKRLQKANLKDEVAKAVPFLHRSCKPLDQVDFSTEEERGQLDMFGNECEGMCGV